MTSAKVNDNNSILFTTIIFTRPAAGGRVFDLWFSRNAPENQNGWFRSVSTAWRWTRPHGRFRKDEELAPQDRSRNALRLNHLLAALSTMTRFPLAEFTKDG